MKKILLTLLLLCPFSLFAQLNISGGALKGTGTNDSAAAGFIGEYTTATLGTGSAVTIATGSATPIVSISLTAGDWDVWGVVDYNPGAATSVTQLKQGFTSAANCLTAPVFGAQDTFTLWETAANVLTNTASPAWNTPIGRISLSATTTVCLLGQGTFTVSTLTGFGSIYARRAR